MSSLHFKTILSNSVSEIVIEKSRFITSLSRIKNEAEAQEFFNKVKKKYFEATHNCTAFILKSGAIRSSDDGEPSGTAGKPMLECLKKNELFNIAVVVTRYFGGVKLGTNGLFRAYGAGVSEAIKKSGVVECILHKSFIITLGYSMWNKVENYLKSNQILFEKPCFAQDIQFKVFIKENVNFINDINNFCHGLVSIELSDTKFIEVLLLKPTE